MKVVFDREAERDLADQLDYLIAQGAGAAGRRLEQRLLSFIDRTLANLSSFWNFRYPPRSVGNVGAAQPLRHLVSLHRR